MEATDLNHMKYLVEVVDSGSFSAAARVFGVPPSLVSRRIARLEAALGARLFQRTTRSLALTDAGRAFLGHARAGLHAFTLAHEALGGVQGVPSGRVRISAPVGLADALWPIASDFLRLHAQVRIEIEFADRYVDLVEGRFDLAIRSGAEGRSDRLVGRRLGDAPRWLVASPAYLEAHGTPSTVADLQHHAAVVLGPRSDRVTWLIHVGKRSQSVVVDGRVAVNEARVAADCAADGFGVAFLPLAVCWRHLASGSLRRILPRANGGDVGLWVVYPDRHLPAASRSLVDFLVDRLPASLPTGAGQSAAKPPGGAQPARRRRATAPTPSKPTMNSA